MNKLYRQLSVSLGLCLILASGAFAQKISKDLLRLAEQKNARVSNITSPSELKAAEIPVYKGYVVVEASATIKNVKKLKSELEKLGMKDVSSYGPVVSGLFPVNKILRLEEIESLHFVRPAYKPDTKVGAVTSQSFIALNADKAREQYGVTGKGVKVGVLSDSYNTLGGAAAGEASGDLPSVEILDEFDGVGIDEGRAMTELIYDIAPGVEVAFHTAFEGQASFAQGIIDLQEAGCDVIVDDVGYLTEPYFQDGIIAQAVDEVVKKGSSYYSSAGNSANDAFEDRGKNRFVKTTLDLTGYENLSTGVIYEEPLKVKAYDFKGNKKLLQRTITLETNEAFVTALQWTDNYFSATGDPNKAAKTDLDFFLIIPEFQVLFSSEDDNINVTGDPIEFNGVTWTGAIPLTVEFVVIKKAGPDPELVRYIDREGQGSFEEEVKGDGAATIYGHSNAKLGIAVGATRYDTTPRFAEDEESVAARWWGKKDKDEPEPPVLEFFSSVGGIPIYYKPNGKKYWRPQVRRKPEIVASQGDNNTFFGFDYEGDGAPNFFGTSASAPNAAAVAALMEEAAKKSKNWLLRYFGIGPFATSLILAKTALDMDNPYTEGFDKGFDFASGYGFINAEKAVAAVLGVKSGYSNDATIARTEDAIGNESVPEEVLPQTVENAVNLFPSRSSDAINLAVQQNDDQEVQISIVNTLGQQVYELRQLGSFNEEINFAQFGKGLYIAKFRMNQETTVRRFIIE